MPPSTTAKKTAVSVVYNGVSKEISFNPRQAVQALLEHALKVFGLPPNNAEGLALFNVQGTQLPPHVSCHEAGIEPGDELFLRPTIARGG
jgi:hypothetical protein